GSALGECPPAPAFGRRLLLDFAQRATPPGSAYLKRVAWLLPQEAAGFELPRSVAGKGVPLTDDSKRSGGGQGHSLSRESAPPEAQPGSNESYDDFASFIPSTVIVPSFSSTAKIGRASCRERVSVPRRAT